MGHHACPQCGKVFSQRGNLTTHIRIVHEQRRDFTCPDCDKGFSVKTSLRNHIRSVHERRRDYNCRHCGKAFTEKGSLQRHIRGVHEKRRDFGCPHCPKGFPDRSALRKHLRAVHGDNTVALADTVEDNSLKEVSEDHTNRAAGFATGARIRARSGLAGSHGANHLSGNGMPPRISHEVLQNLVRIAKMAGMPGQCGGTLSHPGQV